MLGSKLLKKGSACVGHISISELRMIDYVFTTINLLSIEVCVCVVKAKA